MGKSRSPGGATLPHRPLNTRVRVRPSRPSRSGRVLAHDGDGLVGSRRVSTSEPVTVGIAPSLLAAFIGTGSEEASLALPALTGVAGALIGATLGSLRSERLRDLYVREPRRVAVSPLVSRERVGAALAITW